MNMPPCLAHPSAPDSGLIDSIAFSEHILAFCRGTDRTNRFIGQFGVLVPFTFGQIGVRAWVQSLTSRSAFLQSSSVSVGVVLSISHILKIFKAVISLVPVTMINRISRGTRAKECRRHGDMNPKRPSCLSRPRRAEVNITIALMNWLEKFRRVFPQLYNSPNAPLRADLVQALKADNRPPFFHNDIITCVP